VYQLSGLPRCRRLVDQRVQGAAPITARDGAREIVCCPTSIRAARESEEEERRAAKDRVGEGRGARSASSDCVVVRDPGAVVLAVALLAFAL
jgi:hypothetical protein